MASSSGIKIIMGGTGVLRNEVCSEAPHLFATILKHKVNEIDSAVVYGHSEKNLGLHNAGEKFVIHTKIPGGLKPETAKKEQLIKTGQESLERLKLKQVDILYLHSPEITVPFEETLDGMNELYQAGAFRRFGLSNFKEEQVQEVYDICQEKGFVKPSVYQGNYNAFARSYEQGLLPRLRKLGISFYAYSPQAGGFLSKTTDLLNTKGEGRLLGQAAGGDLYKALYKKPTLLEGLTKWNEIAKDAGLHPGDMAVRWVRYNSALKKEYDDAIIIGGRTIEQVEETLTKLEQGPLGEEICKKIDEVWETVKGEAPVDNYHDFIEGAIQAGEGK